MKASKIGMVLALFTVTLWFVPATSFAQVNPCGLPMEKKPAAGDKKAEKGMDKDKGMKDDKAAKGKQGAENPCAPMKK